MKMILSFPLASLFNKKRGFFLAFSLFFISWKASSFEVPSAVQSASQAVWMLKSHKHYGTGFFVSPYLFVTNFHVIESSIQANRLQDISLSQDFGFKTLKIKKLVGASLANDLALLETESPAGFYLSLKQTAFDQRKKAFILGFPSGQFRITSSAGPIKALSSQLFFAVRHFRLFGASGSPVVDEKGAVIGVLFSGRINLTYSILASALKDFIRVSQSAPCETAQGCYDRALFDLLAKAEQQHVFAQYKLSRIYEEGRVVKPDGQEAYEWLKKSAEGGYAPAQYDLAVMIYHKRGLDDQEAYEWLIKSAEGSYAPAQYLLSLMYLGGVSAGGKSDQKAYEWMKESAGQGYAPAKAYFSTLSRGRL